LDHPFEGVTGRALRTGFNGRASESRGLSGRHRKRRLGSPLRGSHRSRPTNGV